MAGSGVEIATAWVRLVPSVSGIQDSLSKEFGGAAGIASKEGKKAGGLFGNKMKLAIGAAAIATGVVAAFKGLYEVGSTFDDVADTIRTGTGATGDALDGLIDVAKNVGSSIPVDFEKAGSAVADINTRMGLSGKTLETVAKQYLEAGRILGEDVDINATSAAFNAFNIEGEGVSEAMDTLFQVSQATGVSMNELATGVSMNAPALKNLGFTLEDSAALMGSLDKAGLNSNQMMAALSKGMVTLAKDGEEPQKAFERVTSEIQGFVDTGDTAAALDLAGKVFGTRGASQFVGALQSGVIGMEDLMGATGATEDTILGVAGETDSFAEKWKVTMNKATVAIEPLATAIFEGLSDGMDAVMPALEDFGGWISENTGVLKIVAGVIGGALVLGLIAMTAAIWASTVAMLANPITWIIVGIVALVAAIVALVMNWDAVVAWITDIWGGFIGWITDGLDAFLGWWNGIWEAVGSFISDVWNSIVSFVKNYVAALQYVITTVIETVKSVWENIWSGISDFFRNIWAGIVKFVTTYINTVKTIITTVVNTVKNIWENIWSGIGSFFSGIWSGIVRAVQKFGGIFKAAFDGIRGFVTSAFSGVVGAVKGPLNGIIGIVNSAIRALNGLSVSIPGWVPIVGGQTFGLSLPTIPQLAEGGIVRKSPGGILANVGEGRYDEVVLPLSPEVLDGLAGGGSDRPVYVQNPWTGEYLLARAGEVAQGVVAGVGRSRARGFRG